MTKPLRERRLYLFAVVLIIQSVSRTQDTEWAFLGGTKCTSSCSSPWAWGSASSEAHHWRQAPREQGSRGHVESLHVLMRQDDTPVFTVELALLMATGKPMQ